MNGSNFNTISELGSLNNEIKSVRYMRNVPWNSSVPSSTTVYGFDDNVNVQKFPVFSLAGAQPSS